MLKYLYAAQHGRVTLLVGVPRYIKRAQSQKSRPQRTMADMKLSTKVWPVDASRLGKINASPANGDILDDIEIELDSDSIDAQNVRLAAEKLRTSSVPVAFPTETVYGLGADATRSDAVRGIYTAKQRPVDNPLIVHFASLEQLRHVLRPETVSSKKFANGHVTKGQASDPIPAIYRPVIQRFWPGPLTIILPNPPNSPLAPEVTAGLSTFGARIPRHVLALALITLSGKPIAAPSANASTKPSPTAAEHVAYDLDGRIETIIDGGPCDVGVESTVVDGLSDPPLMLRPGGISMEQLRQCPGWEKTQIGYRDVSEQGSQPKAPGMKYRHYSPKATVVLYEDEQQPPSVETMARYLGPNRRLGIVRTKRWVINTNNLDDPIYSQSQSCTYSNSTATTPPKQVEAGFAAMLKDLRAPDIRPEMATSKMQFGGSDFTIVDLRLGPATAAIARGIFGALRDLDRQNVDAMFVEGINDLEGDVAAAVMNRLRKAAEIQVG